MPSNKEFLQRLGRDIFPLFIITFITCVIMWMWISGFPFGIILTMIMLGVLGFGGAELIMKIATKRTVSQQWWIWSAKTAQDPNSNYLFCPWCHQGLKFPNRWKALTFGMIFIMIIVIIVVMHLLIR